MRWLVGNERNGIEPHRLVEEHFHSVEQDRLLAHAERVLDLMHGIVGALVSPPVALALVSHPVVLAPMV
jgi:hypothetical protein